MARLGEAARDVEPRLTWRVEAETPGVSVDRWQAKPRPLKRGFAFWGRRGAPQPAGALLRQPVQKLAPPERSRTGHDSEPSSREPFHSEVLLWD